MIDRLNSIVQSALVGKLFKWGNLVMIYGSFILPLGLYFTNDYKIFGSIAWILLIVIMAVRPLSDLFPNFRLFRKILVIRRSLGIFSGMAALTHGIGFFYVYPSEIGASYLLAPNQMFLYGIIGLVFSTLLLITSNNFSVRLLGKRWKWLQKGVYGMFYMVCIHVALIGSRNGIDYTPVVIGGVVFILRALALWKNRHTGNLIF